MRKSVYSLLVVLIVSIILLPVCAASAKEAQIENANLYENESDSIINFVDENGDSFLSQDIIAKENGKEIKIDDVKQLLNEYRIVVVYDMKNSEEQRNSCLMNNNAAVFYYDNDVFQGKYFQSFTKDRGLLKAEIVEFVNEQLNRPKWQAENDNVVDNNI